MKKKTVVKKQFLKSFRLGPNHFGYTYTNETTAVVVWTVCKYERTVC